MNAANAASRMRARGSTSPVAISCLTFMVPNSTISASWYRMVPRRGGVMSPETLFRIQLVLGYVVWFLCFGAYVWPWLRSMDRIAAHRAIATMHSFRFFGLVFILPGVVGPNLPANFASFAAYWDLATGVLAMLALLTVRIRPLFWLFVVGFNVVGT